MRAALLPLLLAPFGTMAQDMVLAGGMLTVSAGTQVRIEAPLTWQLAPGAAVVNHGLIDFGAQGSLVEQAGSPITGTGIESALWAPTAPLVDAEPGGLGLRISTAYEGGGLRVERGHVPRSASNGTLGIARWFRISTPQATAATLDATMQYDLSELNGTVAEELALFSSGSPDGPWTPLITSVDAALQELSGTTSSPIVHITAFDLDAALGMNTVPSDEWRCWPSIVDQELWLSIPPNDALRSLALIDAAGRSWLLNLQAGTNGVLRIDLPTIAAGLYQLRINDGARTFKLVKP